MAILTDAWRKQYEAQFESMVISPGAQKAADSACATILKHRDIYEAVSKASNGVPWDFVAALHYREASLDFTKFLGDGEPLSRATVNVPAHMGPFTGPNAFVDGCIAALKHVGFDKVTDWSLGSKLFHGEEYNGEGYAMHHLPSPYVFAGTSIYIHALYLSDGKFSSTAVDHRIGVAVIIATLAKLTSTAIKGVSLMATTIPTAPTPVTAVKSAVNSTVTLATTSLSTIWTSISGMFGSLGVGTILVTLLSKMDPSISVFVLGALGIAGTVMGVVASVYHLITHVDATNNQTIALGESTISMIDGWFGIPAPDFSADNGSAPAAS